MYKIHKKPHQEVPMIDIAENCIYTNLCTMSLIGNPQKISFEYYHKTKQVKLFSGADRTVHKKSPGHYVIHLKSFLNFLGTCKWFLGYGCYPFQRDGDALVIDLTKRF